MVENKVVALPDEHLGLLAYFHMFFDVNHDYREVEGCLADSACFMSHSVKTRENYLLRRS